MEQPAQPKLIVDPSHIELALNQLFDLALADVKGVAESSYRAFVGVSSLHPKGFNGTSAWADGSAHLRSVMIAKGWYAEDPNNQPRVVSRDKKLAITVSSGNEYTGIEGRLPETRNIKGSQTASSVTFNSRQGILFPVELPEDQMVVPMRPNEQALWMFLYYIDFDNAELRYELSLPTAMAENGKVIGWSQRIIFPPLSFSPEVDEHSIDDMPDIDISVTPKFS